MVDRSTITDPFFRDLFDTLAPEIDKRMVALASGAVKDWAEYQHEVGYIEALNTVLSVCERLENNRYGNRPGEQPQGE